MRPPERGAPADEPRGDGGFTLVEMAVASAVLLVALLLACDLLAESGRLLHHSVARARDPWTLLATELLRNDLRAAEGVFGGSNSALMLSMPGGEVVVWRRSMTGDLSRARLGEPAHTWLRGVSAWSWQNLGNAVEVVIEVDTSGTYLQRLAGALPSADRGAVVRHHLLVANRGGRSEW